MDVWVEPDGEGRWRWGVDDGVHGALVATERGGIAPDGVPQAIAPTWEVTALLLARQGGGWLCVDIRPPTPLRRAPVAPDLPKPTESPTLGERAVRGRQGSL